MFPAQFQIKNQNGHLENSVFVINANILLGLNRCYPFFIMVLTAAVTPFL